MSRNRYIGDYRIVESMDGRGRVRTEYEYIGLPWRFAEDREAVLIPHFSAHNLWHTFCTRFCENETNIKVIQSVMGHKDIQTTLDIYAEVSEKKKNSVFEDLNKKDVL